MNTLADRGNSLSCDELAHSMRQACRQGLLLPQGHQNNRGEKHAERFEARAYLTQGHAQQSGRSSGGSNQQRHRHIPAF
jgi:hypothetical protein